MAVDAPKGLVPIRKADGTPFTGPLKKVVVSSSDTVAIFVGDLVQYSGSTPTSGAKILGEDVAGIPIVSKYTLSTVTVDPANVAGVVVGVKPNPDNLARKYRAASTDAILFICADPDVVYEVQEDADTTPLVAADIGQNVGYVPGTGTTSTGVSTGEIDSTSKNSTVGLPLKIVGLRKTIDNDFYAANSVNGKFEVVINWTNPGFGAGGTTAAV